LKRLFCGWEYTRLLFIVSFITIALNADAKADAPVAEEVAPKPEDEPEPERKEIQENTEALDDFR